MPEPNKPFVVNDRRKFTMDGDLRPDAEPRRQEEAPAAPAAISEVPAPAAPQAASPVAAEASASDQDFASDGLPELKAPTPEQMEQSRVAYDATVERLDVAIRSANPGRDQPPPMNVEQLVQSVYMTAIMQLGGTTPEDQQPQLDLVGAMQSIGMLNLLHGIARGDLSAQEHRMLEGALFDARLALLEVTQALARSAAASAPPANRPSIVR